MDFCKHFHARPVACGRAYGAPLATFFRDGSCASRSEKCTQITMLQINTAENDLPRYESMLETTYVVPAEGKECTNSFLSYCNISHQRRERPEDPVPSLQNILDKYVSNLPKTSHDLQNIC